MSIFADGTFQITSEDGSGESAFLAELHGHLTGLGQTTLTYPAEVEFKGSRFVFNSEMDFRVTVATIEAQLRVSASQASARK